MRFVQCLCLAILICFAVAFTGHPAAAQGPDPASYWPTPARIGPAPAPPAIPDTWYSSQLHIHSWSNHNGAVQPGSVQFHSNWAQQAGLDVIWWTDHNPTFNQQTDTTLSFSQATINPLTADVTIPLPDGTPVWAVYNYVTKLQASTSGNGVAGVALNNGLLRLTMQANTDAIFDRLNYLTLTTDNLKLQGLEFTRPLLSDPLFSFDAARCDSGTADAYGQIRILLSWHNYGQAAAQSLVYRLVPAGEPGGFVTSSNTVTVTVPLQQDRISLPLLDHARLLPDGEDNAIQEMIFSVGARNNATACLELGNFTLHSRVQQNSDLVQRLKDTALAQQAIHNVSQLVSWEQFAGLQHLNGFLPSTATLLPGKNDIQAPAFVPLVHSHNGLVMLNHPFGAGYGVALPAADQEQRVQQVLATLLPTAAWNADMLEIYRLRGRVDWNYHLRLWDLLGVNGVQMCAAATSDTHGGPFTLYHGMVSWINATSTAQDDLLAAMRACRLFFGDLTLFDGVLDLQLGATRMGGIYPMQPGTKPLHVTVNQLPAGAQVKLVQQALIPGTELTHLVDHLLIDPTQPILIDVSQPSQIRVEVWSATGQPIAFSNRILVKALQCDVDSNTTVDIADVQRVAGAFGQSVPPALAAYDLRPDGSINLWDVITAAECWQAYR
ncbi:MAG: hypothetical protein ABTQ73_05745 [Caldilineales bacterium]